MSTEELRALLARLNGEGEPLTNAEIESLNAALLTRADELLDGETTQEVVDELGEIATAREKADVILADREQAAKDLREKAEAAAARIRPAGGTQEAQPEPVEEPEAPEAVAEVVEPEVIEQPAEEPEPVTAATKKVNLSAMNAARPRKSAPKPTKPATPRASATLSAVEGGRGVRAGEDINWEQLAQLMSDRLNRGTRGDLTIATLKTTYPEDRTLREKASAKENTDKIDGIASPEALTASGGICAPIAVDYTVPVFGASTARPLRDALPRFGADRGGIRFVTPPTYSTPAGAVGIWTSSTDQNPGTATKALFTMACASENTVLVDAITMRLKIGNMQGRFSPELVEANTRYALSNAARVADINLWNKINAASTVVTAAQVLGATRDLLDHVGRAAAAVRYRFRMDDGQRLRAIFPEFVKEMIRTDLAKELAHDNSGDYNALAVSDAQIMQFFSVRNVIPTFVLDPLPVTTGTGAHDLQGFGALPSSGGALNVWPTNISWNLFAEGAFQFLDGGSLDLGVVRDSTLDATNDYETFVEQFEAVAFRGAESVQIISTVTPTGASKAGV